MVGLLHHRQDFHLGKGSLAPALVIKGRDAHQAVRTLLHRELAIHVFTVDHKGRRLDACFFRIGDVIDIHFVTVFFRPARIHAHKHFGPVGRVHTAGARADINNRLARVIFTRKHGGDLQRFDGRLQGIELIIRQGGIPLFFREFVHHGHVLQAPAQRFQLANLGLRCGKLRGDLLRVGGVVPQGRVAGLGL